MSAPLPIHPARSNELEGSRVVAPQARPGGWLSPRATLLAFLLAPLTAYWSIDQSVDVIFSLMVPPVVMTLLIAVANLIVRRIAPKFALTEGELIIFYGMHTVIGAMCAEWMIVINPYIHSYALYRSGNTRFDQYILPYAHPWFFVQPQDAD